MLKPYLLIAAAMVLVGSVVGGAIAVNDYYRENVPSSCVDSFVNHRYIWLPSRVSDVFHGDTVNLHFSMINGRTMDLYGNVYKEGIADLHCGNSSSADFDVRMSDLNALELATSVKPVSAFVTLWRSGQIVLEPHGALNEQKLSKADMLLAQDVEPVPKPIRDIFAGFLE